MQFFINGKPVPFEQLDRNLGVLKIASDDPVAAALTASARANGGKGRGGIVAIDEEIFSELKKNLPFKPLAPKSLQQKLRVLQTEPPRKSKAEAGRQSADAANVVVVRPFRAGSISSGDGVAVGGVGAGDDSGKVSPVPVPAIPPLAAPPGEFRPATGKKNFRMPVTKKPTGRSLSGATDEPELKEE